MANLFIQALEQYNQIKANVLQLNAELTDCQLQMNATVQELVLEVSKQWEPIKQSLKQRLSEYIRDNGLHFLSDAAHLLNTEELIWHIEKKLPLQNVAGLPLLDCVRNNNLQVVAAQVLTKIPSNHQGMRIYLENSTEFDLILPMAVWQQWNMGITEKLQQEIKSWLTGLAEEEFSTFEVAATGKVPPLTQEQKLNLLRTLDLEDASVRSIIKQKIESFNSSRVRTL